MRQGSRISERKGMVMGVALGSAKEMGFGAGSNGEAKLDEG